MKTYLSFILLLIMTSCGKIPVPSVLAPSENKNIQKVNFGEEPISYQNILKNYLIINLKNYKTAKVEFINQPTKFSIDHLGNNYSGYRVCLSVNEKQGEHYLGYRNHFFLINNNKVNLHLYDSGLLKIPFENCVSRNKNNEYFIDDIPEQIADISIESMDTIELTQKENTSNQKIKNELERLKQENIELKKFKKNNSKSNGKIIEDLAKAEASNDIYKENDNTYILCSFDNIDTTFVFNANKKTFRLIDKLDIVSYSVRFNEAYIVATNEATELTINRVSGKAMFEDKKSIKGICKLTNKREF